MWVSRTLSAHFLLMISGYLVQKQQPTHNRPRPIWGFAHRERRPGNITSDSVCETPSLGAACRVSVGVLPIWLLLGGTSVLGGGDYRIHQGSSLSVRLCGL